MISVRHNIKEATRILPELSEGGIQNAAQQAINRVLTTARKTLVNELAEEIKPKKKGTIRDLTKMQKASRATNKPVGWVDFYPKPIWLADVKGVQVSPAKKGKRRVYRVRYKGRLLEGAFKTKNVRGAKGQGRGDRHIFRGAKGKYATGNRKMKKLWSFHMRQQMEKANVEEVVNRTMAQRFQIEFKRALRNKVRRLR